MHCGNFTVIVTNMDGADGEGAEILHIIESALRGAGYKADAEDVTAPVDATATEGGVTMTSNNASREVVVEDGERFTAEAMPVAYGYFIGVRRDPHPEGHVPVNIARFETKDWDPNGASDLLRSKYGYVTAPGSYWQPLEGSRSFGIRLRSADGEA